MRLIVLVGFAAILLLRPQVVCAQQSHSPRYPLEEITTTVVPKSLKTKLPKDQWPVYADEQMRNVLFRLAPGDTVRVSGWSPWQYLVKGKHGSGFVSYKALAPVGKMDSINEVIVQRSPAEENIYINNQHPYDTATAKAHLAVTTSKKVCYTGECFSISVAFHVADDNRVRMRFSNDFAMQVYSWLTKDLHFANGWYANQVQMNIEGESNEIDGRGFTTYRILDVTFCPTKAGDLVVPPLTLQLARVSMGFEPGQINTIPFFSKAVKIKVLPFPAGTSVTTALTYKMVGQFNLKDSLYKKGDNRFYKLTLEGDGMLYPLRPPVLNAPGMKSLLREETNRDTIIANRLRSTREFTYEVAFTQQGKVDFGTMYQFVYFDPYSKKVNTLKSKRMEVVTDEELARPDQRLEFESTSFKKYIAIDLSKSMQIEDYKPNRLAAVTNAVERFMGSRNVCDIGIIIFGADALHFVSGNSRRCYAKERIRQIESVTLPSGTAIGNAIWVACNSLKKSEGPGTLVIIGDGDNTAGNLDPVDAAAIAKDLNLNVFTIGVGSKGLVPFGRDENGQPFMIENTFDEELFKKISEKTGGMYFYAKDEIAIIESLKKIFR